jgi:ankyrin repeat protein
LGQNEEFEELLLNRPEEISKSVPGSEDTVPIFTAIRFGNNRALGILLDKGVDANSVEHFFPALHFAVMKGNLMATEKLLEHGANVNTPLSRNLYVNPTSTPLHLAITGTHLNKDHTINLQMVALLLSHGADPHKSSDRQRSPFEIAEALKNEPLLELLGKHTK